MYRVLLFIFVVFLSGCQNGPRVTVNNQGEKVSVDPKTLQQGAIIHDSLTAKQTENIDYLYQTFREVDPTSREKWMEDFKRDQNPDQEIKVWMMMANAYNSFCQKKRLELPVKKEVFQLLLTRSMVPENEVLNQLQLVYLTEKDASEVLQGYKLEAQPVKVIQK